MHRPECVTHGIAFGEQITAKQLGEPDNNNRHTDQPM